VKKKQEWIEIYGRCGVTSHERLRENGTRTQRERVVSRCTGLRMPSQESADLLMGAVPKKIPIYAVENASTVQIHKQYKLQEEKWFY